MSDRTTGPSRRRPPRSAVREQQIRRFNRLFVWSLIGAIVVTAGLYLVVRNVFVTASFLLLMVVMAAFLSAYYAMLRVER